MSFDTAALIVNTHSRKGHEGFECAKDLLANAGIKLERATASSDAKEVIRQVQEAAADSVPLIVVGGGDGTIGSIAEALIDSQSTLGILPTGTGNVLAHDLELPQDFPAACEVILNGKTIEIDVGKIEDRYFVNVVSVGLTAHIARELDNTAKRTWGRLVYAASISKALARVRPFRATLETPGDTREFETLQVVIGSGRIHAGPFPVSPDASLTSGKLSLYALTGRSKIGFLKIALRLYGGQQVELPEVISLSLTEGKLMTTPPRSVVADGELFTKTPVNFQVVPQALRVRVPASGNLAS